MISSCGLASLIFIFLYFVILRSLKTKEIELLEGMIEEMDFGFAKGGRIKASNGLGVLMDIFNAGNQRIETGDIDARFRPLPEIDEDTVSEDEKRIALLEDEIRYLMEGGTLEANRDLIGAKLWLCSAQQPYCCNLAKCSLVP